MTQKQNIKYFSIVGLLMGLVLVGFLCMSAVQYRVTSRLDKMIINFNRPFDQEGFINKAHVIRLIKNTFGDDLSDRAVDETDLGLIEEILTADTYISTSNAYLNGANKLVIDIKERIPTYRVMHDGTDSYYVDGDAQVLPIHKRYVQRVPIVTVDRNHKALSREEHGLLENLVDKIDQDEFLNALVEQIHLDGHGELFIIPKIGKEKIRFGKIEDIEEKFYKIKQFYKKGMTTMGWNKYEEINLSYKDQVIATIKE